MANDPKKTELKAQTQFLQLIYALNAIATSLQESIHDEDNVYRVFRKQVVALGLRGGISLLDGRNETLIFKTVAFTNPLRRILKRFENQFAINAEGYSVPVESVNVYKKVICEGQTVFMDDTSPVSAQVVPRQFKILAAPLLAILGRPPGIFAPLIYDGKIKGMLNIVGPSLTENDVPTIQAFANQIAVALENARLVKKLQTANEKLEVAYQKTLEGWVKAMNLRNQETEEHTRRTVEATAMLASFMGVPDEDIPFIRRGALLHDIGKMAIPDSILLKPAPLSESEWLIMKQHPQTAYTWLSSIDYLNPSLVIPYYHHERWDGSGYVQGLQGEEIPYWARIFAVIDVWDALRSNRPYRLALPEEQALQYIKDGSGKLFDPQVVKAFLDLYAMNSSMRNNN